MPSEFFSPLCPAGSHNQVAVDQRQCSEFRHAAMTAAVLAALALCAVAAPLTLVQAGPPPLPSLPELNTIDTHSLVPYACGYVRGASCVSDTDIRVGGRLSVASCLAWRPTGVNARSSPPRRTAVAWQAHDNRGLCTLPEGDNCVAGPPALYHLTPICAGASLAHCISGMSNLLTPNDWQQLLDLGGLLLGLCAEQQLPRGEPRSATCGCLICVCVCA